MNKKNSSVIASFISLSRFILGVVFIFSGFVKLIDPIGGAYKIEEYLISFNLIALKPLSLYLSISLSIFELLLGVFLLLAIYIKSVVRIASLFMLFMTVLTLYVYIENPVSDCGCFGDAIVVSNGFTFLKNIVLSFLALVLLFNHKYIRPCFSKKMSRCVALCSLMFFLLFSLYSSLFLPIVDFRSYKIGNNISKLVEAGKVNRDKLENIFVYEKDGVKQEFSDGNYPWQDSTWHFVEMKSRIVEKDNTPKIEDFALFSIVFNSEHNVWLEDEDISYAILNSEKPIFLAITPDINDAKKSQKRLIDIYSVVEKSGGEFYIATSSSGEDIAEFEKQTTPLFSYIKSNDKVLKTIVRSSPGLVYLDKGVVRNKWSAQGLPSDKCIVKEIERRDSEIKPSLFDKTCKPMLVIILFLCLLLTFKLYDKKRS